MLVVGWVAGAQAQVTKEAASPEIPEIVAASVVPAAPGASTAAAAASLPDAPGASSSLDSAPSPELQTAASLASTTPHTAGKYDTVILPGQTAARLTAHDKVIFGIKDSLSPFSAAGWVLSAAYEQVTDGSPNYGVLQNTQTGKSFAQRLGAAAARDTSETIFSESILAPILHEDPRYYAKTNRNFFYRVIYAGTRPVLTRTNGGRTTINLSQLGGNLAGSALTQAYYPPLNRGFTEVLKTFGGSVGGSAVGDLASEFLPGLLEAVHFKKKE
jgi:hypothetical protein